MRAFRKHNNKDRRRGAALVEAAVVLPIFLLIVLGIVEFGRAMMVVQLITNGSREGARKAIIDGSSNADVTTHVRTFLSNTVGVAGTEFAVDITVDPDPSNSTSGNEVGDAQPGDLVNVAIAVPYSKVSYLAGGFLSGRMLRARTTMRHE